MSKRVFEIMAELLANEDYDPRDISTKTILYHALSKLNRECTERKLSAIGALEADRKGRHKPEFYIAHDILTAIENELYKLLSEILDD